MEHRPTQRPNRAEPLGALPRLAPARRESIADQVFRTLRSSIVMMRLTPGTALSEQDIAGRLDVSRQPVREAFIKLSEVGLVRVVPQRGTFVVKISAQAVTDARFVREAVECAIARRAAQGLEPGAVDALQRVIAEQRAAAKAADTESFFVADEAFHLGLAGASGCTYAWKVIEEAKAQMDRVRFLSIPDATPMARLIAQHQDILDAIAARRGAAAEQAMREHLQEILRSLPRLARAFPDMFEADGAPVRARGEGGDPARSARRPGRRATR